MRYDKNSEVTLCCQDRGYRQPVKDENAGKMPETSAVLVVSLSFCHFLLRLTQCMPRLLSNAIFLF